MPAISSATEHRTPGPTTKLVLNQTSGCGNTRGTRESASSIAVVFVPFCWAEKFSPCPPAIVSCVWPWKSCLPAIPSATEYRTSVLTTKLVLNQTSDHGSTRETRESASSVEPVFVLFCWVEKFSPCPPAIVSCVWPWKKCLPAISSKAECRMSVLITKLVLNQILDHGSTRGTQESASSMAVVFIPFCWAEKFSSCPPTIVSCVLPQKSYLPAISLAAEYKMSVPTTKLVLNQISDCGSTRRTRESASSIAVVCVPFCWAEKISLHPLVTVLCVWPQKSCLLTISLASGHRMLGQTTKQVPNQTSDHGNMDLSQWGRCWLDQASSPGHHRGLDTASVGGDRLSGGCYGQGGKRLPGQRCLWPRRG